MKSLSNNILLAILFFTVFGNVLCAKELNESAVLNQNNDEEIVINIKMVERFYAMYDSIVVIPWGQLLTNDFDDAKNYIAAYRNIDLNNVNNAEVVSTLEKEANKLKSGDSPVNKKDEAPIAALSDLENKQ